MATTIKAVAYYRMSSDKQETSIDDQRSAVEEFAAKHGYRIVREYVDEGISGWKSEERHGFKQLISDAETRGDFQAVVVWNQDRFSRFDPLEANHYWYLLDRSGVHIMSVAQGRLRFDDLGEWLKASVVQHGKAEYCRDLSRNVVRGLRSAKLSGKWVGRVPYGYRNDNGTLVHGPASEVELVRRIFRMRADGVSLNGICRELMADGIPTCGGGTRWVANAVDRIIRRETYIGNTVIGLRTSARFNKMVDTPETFHGTHEPIIDRATWVRVQAMPRRQRAPNGTDSHDSLLNGLLVCGVCGCKMYSSSQRKPSGHMMNFYRCCGNRTGVECIRTMIRQPVADAAVVRRIQQTVLGDNLDRMQAAFERQLARVNGKDSSEVDKLESQLSKLDEQIDAAHDRLAIVDASMVDGLQKAITRLNEKRQQLRDRIDSARHRETYPRVEAEQLMTDLWRLDKVLRDDDADARRRALRWLVDRVVVNFEATHRDGRGLVKRLTGGSVELCKSVSESVTHNQV